MRRPFLVLTILMLAVTAPSWSFEPLTMSYQGILADDAGVPVDDGDYEVELTITDDGGGFSPTQVQGQAGSFGLLGMAERAEGLGGHLEIESTPGAGTRVTVQCACSRHVL